MKERTSWKVSYQKTGKLFSRGTLECYGQLRKFVPEHEDFSH